MQRQKDCPKAKVNILDCYIDQLDLEQVLGRIEEYIDKRHPRQIVTLNAEIIVRARTEQSLRELINEADLVTPDGIGVVWAGKIMQTPFPERVTGIDLLYALGPWAVRKGWKVFLLGAAPEVARQAGIRLEQLYPGIVICGTRDGYFSEWEIPEIIAEIRRAQPDILAVGLGAPKQEFFIKNFKEVLGVPVAIGIGGSLDVIAGAKKRAPSAFIKFNLEWLYRLLSEPSRSKRQLALPKFAGLVLKNKYFSKDFEKGLNDE